MKDEKRQTAFLFILHPSSFILSCLAGGPRMNGWRTRTGVGLVLVLAAAAPAQQVTLAEPLKARDCFKVSLDMKLAGQMRFQRDGKVTPLKLTAQANHVFPERVLSVGKDGRPDRVARAYEKASAVVTLGRDDPSERTLRKERTLVVAQRDSKDVPLCYSPAGPLTLGELELAAEHFDTLALVGLLQGKAVAVGETWKVSNSVAQALCHFEGLAKHDLECKLDEADDKVARLSVRGSAEGIDLGSQVKLTVTASLRFNRAAGRIVWAEWKQKDEREQGPASPASTVEATTVLTRRPSPVPDSLADAALASLPAGLDVPAALTQLELSDPKGRFALVHGRDWQLVGQTDEHVVLRLMERGDFVAQVTLTPWKAAAAGKHQSPDEFRETLQDRPGWEPQRELDAGEGSAGGGRWVYRGWEQGELEGVEVVQTCFAVAAPDGRQAIVTFVMTPKQTERLAGRDLALVNGLTFPAK